MFRVRSLIAPLSLLFTCMSLASFAQKVPVIVEIHSDGNPVSLNMSQVRSNDSTHTYHAGDTLNSFSERWAVYSKTENLESGDTLDYELNRVPNITTTGTINHNTVTNGNLLGAQIYTYSNPTTIAVTATENFIGQKFFYDSYNNSSSCSKSESCAASCSYTYNGSNVFTPGGCGHIWTTHWSWGAPTAWGAQGSNSCSNSVTCSTSHTGVNDKYQGFMPVWQNGISGWTWTDQFALPNSWTPGTLTHYGSKATRNHVAHSYWNELTITDAKLCVAAGHLYVWGDGNNHNQHQNGASTSIGTSTNNTNIGNSSQWSCRANIHSKNDLIAVRNAGANGGHSLDHGQVRIYESKTANASNTKSYSASCSWGPTYWGWPSQPSAASTSCYQHSGTTTAHATATVNYATGGYVRMDWTQQSTTGEVYSEINSTAPGVIGQTTTIDEIRLTLNANTEWGNTFIHLQAPNGDRMMLRGWQINLPSNIHTHTLKFRDDGNAPLSSHYSNGLALGNDPMHEFYQAWEGLMNSHFAGCSASGSWKVWVSDYQGYQRTYINDFEIDFAGDQQRKWETTAASSDKTSGVGTDVHFDYITINHNLVNDVDWTLKNNTNGSVINLGSVQSGVPIHLHNENSFPVGALNDDWAVEASTSYWHPNDGKTISSWVIDYSGRSLPIGEGCVTSPNGCSTSSDPVLAGLDVVSVPEYDPQDKSWSLVAQEVETNSGVLNGQLRFLGHAFGTPGASSFNIGPNLTDYNDEILIVNGDKYYLFKTDDPFFVNSVDKWMHIVNFETNDLELKNAVNASSNNGEVTFCRGAAHPNDRPGNTSWGILPANSTARACGCNSTGWEGWGVFYGGSADGNQVQPNGTCTNMGGRFAGYAGNWYQKGALSTGHPTRIYVRNACTDVNDRPVAARVYPAHLAPDCADDERTLFLHETGQATATVELAPLVDMHANNSELASGPNAYLAEDLVAWYGFDGNGDDQGPYRDPLTPNGVSWTADRFGNPHSAVAFDGVDDHMLNDELTGMQGSSSYTVAFWVKKLSANCEKGHILCQNNSAYEESQTLALGYRPCVGECPNGGCFYHSTVINFQYTTTNSTNSNWHHMAVTFDEATGRRTIFEDGVLLIADSLGRYSGDFSKGLLLGNCWWAHLDAFTNDWFEGQLDELGLWSRAFSDAEIQTLYQSSAQAPQSPPMLHPGHRYVAQGTTMDGEQLYDVYDLINDEYHLGVELKPSLPSRNIVSGTNDAFQLQAYVLDAVTLGDGTTGRTSSAQALIDQETTTPGSLSPFKRTLVDNDKVHSVYLKHTLDGVETVPEVHLLAESDFGGIFGAGTQPGKGNARVPLLETEPTDWERWLVVAPMDIPKTAPSEALDTDDLRLSTHASNGDAVGTTAKTPTWHMHPIDLKAIVSNGAIAPTDVTAEQLPASSWMVLNSPQAGQPWTHPLDADLPANEQRNVMVMPWDLGTQLWRDGADVDTYYSNDMVTAIDDENTISVSFPLTPPYYTQGVGATMAYTNADAFERGYPYWGIQNGTEAYAEIFVKLKDEFTGAEHLVYRNTKTHPLILKDCPYILQDSVRLDITAAELPSTIQTGDPIDVEAVVLWTTDARRTALWSKNEPHNRLTMCGAFNELFALNDDLVEIQDLTNNISTTTVTWNALPGKQSNGGFMRLQRRSGSTSTGEEDGWEYIKASATSNGETFTVSSFDTPSTLLTSDPSEAYVWVNSDINSDNIIDRIQFTDNSLLHSDWQCEQVEYRVEQEMCGSYFYTEPVNMTILGELSDPWTLDDELGTSVQVSQGVYANKVKINWASAIDPEANIMQFRVFRRRYEPLDNPAPWDLIFAAEDANQYEDVDLMAGTLYEYRMAAIMGCSTGEGSFETQDFYSPTNFIGFRTNNSSVSGTITYDEPAPEGPPSGNAMVSIEPQGTAEVRNALNLESDYFLHMDIPETSSQYLNWPNLTSADADWTLSQWVKISEPMESGESTPIVSFNFNDYQGNPSEAFSIWARQQADGNLWIQLVQAGNPSTFFHDEYSITLDGDTLTHGAATEVTAPFNEYFHLSIRLSSDDQGRIQLRALVDENDIALRGHSTFAPALTGLMSHADYLAGLASDADAPILTPLRHPKALTLGGGVQLADEIRSGWSSVRWNAASAAGENCHSPEATNFAPATIGSSQDGCEFDIALQGCADPAAGLSGGYNAALTSNVPQFAGNLTGGPTPCDYTANAFGSMISIRWFSDGSTGNEDLEFPVIIQNGQVIRSFHSALSSLQSAQGADYAYSMPVLTTKIPDGAYSIRVLQSASDVTGTAWNGLDATTFTGNFSVVDDHGVEYVNCLQYVASEAASGVYDFTVAPSACAALFSAAPNDTGEDQLITDCSSAYSVRYMGDAAAQTSLSFSSHGQSTTDTNPLIEFWFKLDGSTAGDILTVHFGSQDLTLRTEAQSSSGFQVFVLEDEAGNKLTPHTTIPDPEREFDLNIGQWYHAQLQLGDASKQSFQLRGTDYNDNDFAAWNDTRLWEWSTPEASSLSTQSGQTLSSLELGGGAEVSFHRVSIWENPSFANRPNAMFNGIGLADLQSCEDCNGLWDASGDIPWTALRSVLVPNHMGQFVDQMGGRQLFPNGVADELGSPRSADETKVIWDMSSTATTATAQLDAIGAIVPDDSTHSLRKPTRTAPYGESNSGCSRVFNACNFNPFSNVFASCDLSCANVSTSQGGLISGGIILDEIRGFQGAPATVLNEPGRTEPYTSLELANYWRMKYPNNETDGLFLMYDADEGMGNIVYDRSKNAADAWNQHHAKIWFQNTETVQGVQAKVLSIAPESQPYHFTDVADLPMSLGNWDITNVNSGEYQVGNVKYSGTGTLFDVIPQKATGSFAHSFLPSQSVVLAGDATLNNDNNNFIDKSSFDVYVRVVYQDITGTNYSTENSTPSTCPVEGVRFIVDNAEATDGQSQPYETNVNGYVKLSLSRGEHTIEPQLSHLNGTSQKDDHVFLVSEGGRSITVEGPIDSAHAEVFVDLTVRRMVGRIIGGKQEASLPWGTSLNNLGRASLWLSPQLNDGPVYTDPQANATFMSNHACPAVQIHTDPITGQYDISVLPIQYVPAKTTDPGEAHLIFPSGVAFNGPEDIITVEGWQLDTPGEGVSDVTPGWPFAFHTDLFVNGSGVESADAPHTVWDPTELDSGGNWNEFQYQQANANGAMEVYPDGLPSGDASHRVTERVDLVYDPPMTLTAYQTERLSDSNGGTVPAYPEPDCNWESRVIETDFLKSPAGVVTPLTGNEVTAPLGTKIHMGDIVLGEPRLFKRVNGQKYMTDFTGHLRGYALYLADQDNNAAVFPFPLGLPVVETSRQYCFQFNAGQDFHTKITDSEGSVLHEHQSRINAQANDLAVNITNTMAANQSISIPLNGSSTAGQYAWSAGDPETMDPATHDAPTGRITASLSLGGNTIASWEPYKNLIGEDVLQSVTGGGIDDAYEHDAFNAIVLGNYVSGQAVPLSSDPSLLFILRDPPGGGSTATIAEGKSMSYSREVESSSGTNNTMSRNADIGFGLTQGGEWNIAPFGIGKSEGADLSTGGGGSMTQTEEFARNEEGGVSVSESLEFGQTITTSGDAANQDLFFGRTRNSMRTEMTHFSLLEKTVAADMSFAQETAAAILDDPNLATTMPAIPHTDNDGDGVLDQLIMLHVDENNQFVTTSDPTSGNPVLDYISFVPTWYKTNKTIEAPASMFMYTEYTIENIMIPLLEAQRDQYAASSGYYSWPTGQAITLLDAEAPADLVYPEGMKLANNDDPRWSLYHENWLSTMRPNYPQSAVGHTWEVSTIARGYQTGNANSTLSEDETAFMEYTLGQLMENGDMPSFFPDMWKNTYVNTLISGDDRKGPGYLFEVPASELATINADRVNGSLPELQDIELDSVRYYNTQIGQWKKILAKNELDKLNARYYLTNNLDNFDDPAEINSWRNALTNTSSDHLQFNIEDLAGTSEDALAGANADNVDDVDLWSAADFEPYVIAFSGGGAEFSQSISKTNTKTEMHAMENAALIGNGGGGGFEVGSFIGYSFEKGTTTSYTEKRTNSTENSASMSIEYTLSDPDEEDFFLVAVVPGSGMDGPIFVTLGGVSSCEHEDAIQSKYWEWFPSLVPGEFYPHSSNFTCGTNTTPVWNRTVDLDYTALTPSGKGSWNPNNSVAGDLNLGANDAQMGAMVGGAAGAAAAVGVASGLMGCIGCGVAAGVGAVAIGAMGGIDIAAHAGWRMNRLAELGTWEDGLTCTPQHPLGSLPQHLRGRNFFGYQTGANQTTNQICQAGFVTGNTKEYTYTMAPQVCSALDPTANATLREETFVVKPTTVAAERAELTFSHDYLNPNVPDLVGVSSTTTSLSAPQNETIGVTLHMKHNPLTDPYGDVAEYILFSDPLANTAGFNVNLGGLGSGVIGSTTGGYGLAPAWSTEAEDYDIFMSITHSGVDGAYNGPIDIIMQSACDSEIADTVRIPITFEPACSQVELNEPYEGFVGNLDEIRFSPSTAGLDGENRMDVQVDVEREDFTNWSTEDPTGVLGGGPVIVEFRTDNTIWSTISNRSDYGTNGTITLDGNNMLSDPSFSWNPKMPASICGTSDGAGCTFEGNVFLRAKSQCANMFAAPEYSSEITGYLDFLRPNLFGDVLPLDHHYELGDEIKLRWSEAMETTAATESLQPVEVQVSGTFNDNFQSNSGGVAFMGNEYLGVPEGPNLEAYLPSLDVGTPGWHFSCRLYKEPGSSVAASHVGHIMTVGDIETSALAFELHGSNTLKVNWYVAGQVQASHTDVLPTLGNGWNTLQLQLEPKVAGDGFDITRTLGTVSSYPILISNFSLPNRRITFGNGWQSGAPTGQPLAYPIQDIRLWSSMRETVLSEEPAFALFGNEMGLQLWLPLDELEGVPVDEARNRGIEMAGNWFSDQPSHALDMAGNANGSMILSATDITSSPSLARNATLEFWVKPASNGGEQCILGINPAGDINLDANGLHWNIELDNSQNLKVVNNGNTLLSSTPVTTAWHHVALVRELGGALTLYLDGENVASGPADSFGPLLPQYIHIGGRRTGGGHDYDRFFTGKLDELRVWATNLPIATIREHTREAVQGHPDLMVHMPFEAISYEDCSDGSTLTSTSEEYFSYALNEQLMGYDFIENGGNNDEESMLDIGVSMCHASKYEFGNHCCADPTADLTNFITGADAPLMQAVSQTQFTTDAVASVTWNSLHDEMILQLSEAELWKLEDQLVTFTLPKDQVRDAYGNAVSNNVVFDLLIDRNPLNWGGEFLSEVRMTDDEKTFTTTIVNSGYEVKTFEIVGAPTWLEVTPSSGQIMPQSEMTISMSAPEFMNIGEYACDLHLKGGLPCGSAPASHCYGDRFAFNLDVQVQSPDFSVDSWMFESLCPVTAQVYINDIASSNPRNVVLAYIGGELRGVAKTDMPVSGNQLAFLSVYYNASDLSSDGVTLKPIEFRVWDASTGIVRALCTAHHPTIHDAAGTFLPTTNGHGSMFQPLRIKAGTGVQTQTTLTPGWNWVSFNIEPEASEDYMQSMFSGIQNTDIVQIKSHNLAETFFSSGVWQPGSPRVDVNARYEVKMATANPDAQWTLSNLGNAANEDVTIKQGWNDLGFMPQQPMSTEVTLRSLADAEVLQPNDLIASRYEGFALYAGDGEWVGSLTTMRPGQGYRLRVGTPDPNNAPTLGTLEWPEIPTFINPNWLHHNPLTGVSRPDDAWSMNVQDCPDMMTIVARTVLPSDQSPSPGDHLGAFILDAAGEPVCIGQALPMMTDNGVCHFLSLYRCHGEDPTLHFKWQSGISGEELDALEVLSFQASSMAGTLQEPIQFTFEKREELTLEPGHLVAYPNPFREQITVYWHGMERVESLTVRDANGRLINRLNCNGINDGPCTWETADIAPGVYFITALTERGPRTIKVVK